MNVNCCGSLHSNFIPHSPLSYSTSYSPHSPLKDQPVKCADELVVASPGKASGGVGPTSKSILKNPTTLFFKEQQKKMSKNDNTIDSTKKTAEQPTTRKETLKTVAFGLTTRLEDTVLANQNKSAASNANRINKTVIFSHEAQSLHKIMLAQQAEIIELREKVVELVASDGRRRCEEREQKNIVAQLSSRLAVAERALANIGQRRCEENREMNKFTADECSFNENANPEGQVEEEEEQRGRERRLKTSVGKRMVLKQRQPTNESNKYQNNEVECIRLQKRPVPMPHIDDEALVHRNEILQRLDNQMRKNPHFENRVKSMLRVWTDDVSSPTIGTSVLEHPREESGGGTSMVVRVTTQHQELFYSSSPGRNRNAQPIPRRQQMPNQQPIVVTELSDNSGEEQPETVPNVRRSDHCTDDAEFFQNNDDEQLDDDFGHCARRNNNTFNQQPFRRRRREATSAIRNKYK